MKLLIDAGNTRIKWALLAGEEWLHLTAVPSDQAHILSARVAHLPAVREVWVSNVAGAEVARHIQAACASRGWQPKFIGAQKIQCGVSNGYSSPEQLGSDRWAALIAAWHRAGSSALVVNCGTATTIDALSARGEFLGGLILPGLALMQSSVIATAAQLQQATGRYAAFPVNTADAVWSGALQATCGAIQRQHELLGDAHAPVFLSGGAAQPLQELIKLPVHPVVDLVLQGLKLIAQEASAS
jgi:type III pantothenate kinase